LFFASDGHVGGSCHACCSPCVEKVARWQKVAERGMRIHTKSAPVNFYLYKSMTYMTMSFVWMGFSAIDIQKLRNFLRSAGKKLRSWLKSPCRKGCSASEGIF
ncbi:hypothetical protein ACIPM0_26470, partial [Pseudomonas sichuanensis]|uniref:hypothetical protein n=1 Tax=Pseudomonas sichuanensis TaxID=2213015 RepID=UPI00381CB22E